MALSMDDSVLGVGLIVVCRKSVLLLIEKQTRPEVHKCCGQWSFPMETREKNENLKEVLARLLSEELPGLSSKIKIARKPLGTYQVVKGVWLRVFKAKSDSCILPAKGSCDNSVGGHCWKHLYEALSLNLRGGAYEPLNDIMMNRSNVYHKDICRVPLMARKE